MQVEKDTGRALMPITNDECETVLRLLLTQKEHPLVPMTQPLFERVQCARDFLIEKEKKDKEAAKPASDTQ